MLVHYNKVIHHPIAACYDVPLHVLISEKLQNYY